MADIVTYSLRLTRHYPAGEDKVFFDLCLPVAEAALGHPMDVFDEVFRKSCMEAATQMAETGVREIPVYRFGELEPIAWVMGR